MRAAGAVLVTTPQDVALADVVRAKQMFDKVHIPVLGHRGEHEPVRLPALPRRTPIFNHGGGAQGGAAVRHPVPRGDPAGAQGSRVAGTRASPWCVSAPESPEAQAFMQMAQNIAGRVSAENMRGRCGCQWLR